MADDPNLRIPSFAAHATRGLIRNQATRRRLMTALIGLALLMIILGSTLLAPAISPREHLVGFIVYWAICGWVTLTVILLALFDILVVKRDARTLRKTMERDFDDP